MQNEEFEAALNCVQRGLAIKQKWITEEEYPTKFGESYKNLACIRVYQEQTSEAVNLAKRSHALFVKANGPDAQSTLKACFVYGCVLLATGDIQAAKAIHKDTLARRRTLLGENSFITKDSIYVLGEIYRLLAVLQKPKFLHGSDRAGCGQEAIARAQYHLLLVLRSKSGSTSNDNASAQDALLLQQQVQKYKQTLELTAKQLRGDDLHIFDYISSIWSGRSLAKTLAGSIQESQADFPNTEHQKVETPIGPSMIG
ncbi:hypothetical protein DL98DRAFT_587202 [Cadophora sp. DSE1049]|nr:hypothetical protein DL98DRAFT_587202 [Cadophora sp. DSE1049]